MLTTRATKLMVLIQWVTRTGRVCWSGVMGRRRLGPTSTPNLPSGTLTANKG